MSFIRRTPLKFWPQFLKSSDSRSAVRLVKLDGNLMCEVDDDVVRRSLEGTSGKYADKVTTVLKEAAEEISRDLVEQEVVKFGEKITVPEAAFHYIAGAVLFTLSINHWRYLLSGNHY